jgi:hypothetical protein
MGLCKTYFAAVGGKINIFQSAVFIDFAKQNQ